MNSKAMTDPGRESDLFKKMISLSLMFHVSLILVLSLKALFFPSQALDLDSSVKVDLVALPDKLPETFPAPAPAPATATATATKTEPVPQPVPLMKPEPPAAVVLKPAKPKELTKSDALKKIQQFKDQERRQKALEEIQKQINAEDQKAHAERLTRAKEALVKGNRLSPGTALKGLNRAAFSDYISQIKENVHQHWNTPQWLHGANLVTVVHVYIDHRGVVIKRIIEKSSGDSAFDSYALQAVDDSQPFAPPPEKFVDLVQLDGIYLNLKP